MGLLDDAIREHLDLKRRRGADPAEVARAEQEALGPVRREPEPAVANGGDEHAEAHDAGHGDAPVAEPVAEAHEPTPAAEHDEPAPDPRESDVVHQPTTEFHVEDHHDDEDAHAEAPVVHEPAPVAHDEPAPAHEAPPHDDDVLEETPDFLQETPEHDRLWFEQRPPRDFDFDG